MASSTFNPKTFGMLQLPPRIGGTVAASMAQPQADIGITTEVEDPTEMDDTELEGDPIEEEMGAIPPEAVCYRGANQKCSACEYFEAGNTCSRLQAQVEPQASCNLFEDKSSEADQEASMGEEVIE